MQVEPDAKDDTNLQNKINIFFSVAFMVCVSNQSF